MTREEFYQQVDEGAKLIIVDGLVLNVTDFIAYHPGG